MNIFRPKEHVRDVQSIDLDKLKRMGITNLIVDLDETLRKRNSTTIPASSIDWVKNAISKGFRICISSNNPFPWINKKIEAAFGVPGSFFALKPFPIAYFSAMKKIGSKRSDTAFIGDQLFTDMLGANLLGIYSILVNPITGAEKGFFRRIMRWLEQRVFPRVNLDL